ncbi:uncharacterized protein LOC131232687 isoform X2 [Magnolia sinica]|uniref:uncharacterized protein LOC131232687 isoform X2 n=1 Tax=Magnolia sinica TaxID=86752 RepID=UPI00265ABC44|nr:uncharacterized protein LOC131232687 isoform X2 [Magnolia sinica]
MEGSCALSVSSSKTRFPFNLCNSSSRLKPTQILTLHPKQTKTVDFRSKNCVFLRSSRNSIILSPPCAVAEALEQTPISPPPSSHLSPPRETPSKVDKSGRFCSPRAARELALLIAYAACLDGSDPVRLFDKRVHAKRFPGFIFDKASLLEYDHMSFGGPPVPTETEEEAEELQVKYDNESAIEEDVLSAPPKLVYNRSVLRLSRNILEAVVDRWDHHILVIDKMTPPNWKIEANMPGLISSADD